MTPLVLILAHVTTLLLNSPSPRGSALILHLKGTFCSSPLPQIQLSIPKIIFHRAAHDISISIKKIRPCVTANCKTYKCISSWTVRDITLKLKGGCQGRLKLYHRTCYIFSGLPYEIGGRVKFGPQTVL